MKEKITLDNLNKDNLNNLSKEMLMQMVLHLAENNQELNKTLNIFKEEINVLRNQRFGRHSEKNNQPDGQMKMCFNEAEFVGFAEETPEEEPKAEETVPKATQQTKKKHKKNSRSNSVTANVNVKDILHTLTGEELKCECGGIYKKVGDETVEQLIFHQAYFELEKHTIEAYSCDKCHSMKKADRPKTVFPGSLATPSLLSGIMTAKYVNAMPFNRLEKTFKDVDVNLSRGTMARWMVKTSERYISLLYDHMKKEFLKANVIHADETPVEVSKDGRKAGSKSYMWVYTNEGPHQVVLFDYEKTRKASHPKEFLENYSGHLCCDGYEGYHSLPDSIVICGCWAHARRHFCNAQKALKKESKGNAEITISEQALDKIGELFHLDKGWRNDENISREEHAKLRETVLKEKMDAFFEWVELQKPKILPKTETGKGLTYCLNQKKYLIGVLSDPEIPLDNSEVERKIRNFVISRKNFVLIDTLHGAEASAILFSLAETAKVHHLKCHDYFEYVIKELVQHNDDPSSELDHLLANLMPWSEELPKRLFRKDIPEN